jgi:hypothetical protein
MVSSIQRLRDFKNNKEHLISGFVGFVIGSVLILVLSTTGCFKFIYGDQKYVFVDVEQIISHILPTISKHSKDDNDASIRINLAKSIFKEEIDNFAKENSVLVLNSPGIIAGAEDITEPIEKILLSRLAELDGAGESEKVEEARKK